MQALIRCANQEDIGKLREFLTMASLGTDGLTEETVEYFLLLEDEEARLRVHLEWRRLRSLGCFVR